MNEVKIEDKPKVWITRTAPAAFKSASAWAQAGYAAAVAPVLEITHPDITPELPAQDGVIIFTSGNAVTAFAEQTSLRHWPVVTVGEQTKRMAHDAGFREVTSANGTSDDVTKIVMREYTKTRPIFHCCGNHVRGTIMEDLQRAGYRAKKDLYYRSAPVATLPKIDTALIDVVALYSPLGAKTVASFNPDLTQATLVSLSPAIDAAFFEAAGDVSCKARLIADAPRESALIDAVTGVNCDHDS